MKRSLFTLWLSIIFLYVNLAGQSTWSPDKCLTLKNISATAISPDGNKALYSVREAILSSDRSEYINQIWLADLKTGNSNAPVQLTHSDKNSTQPDWSPDGQWISFISNRDGKNNVYLLPTTGGESQKITDVKSAVTAYKWSPDGQSIALIITDAVGDEDEKSTKAKNDWYYMDEKVKQNRLYVLNRNVTDSTGKSIIKKLTQENYNVIAMDWSPDGQSIVFSHGKTPEANDGQYSDISIMTLSTGKVVPIANTPAGESNPLFSPDGKWIAYSCTGDPVDWSGPNHVNIYSLTEGKPRPLKSTPNEEPALIGWSSDGQNILVAESNKTFAGIYALSIDGKNCKLWNTSGSDLLTAASINKKGTHLSFLLQSPSILPQAYISTVASYAPIKITSINSEWANAPLPKTELIKWKSKDGKEIEGLLTYPLHYVPGQKVPFILNVHGGPAGAFNQSCIASNGGVYPLAALAEKGYAILRANPRGSTGYGAEFRMANRKDWGGMDYQDLMTGVDEVIKMGVADESKMGVMGWSYGGFMSSWIVGHTDRFKVASIGAPVVDLAHQNLTDDVEGFLPSYFKADPWNDWALYDEHSPLRFVQNVKTPVQLQHGEADLRVPFSNSVMFYNALRRRHVPVRLLALPRQPHSPTEPRMILKTMQTNVEWLDQYLAKPKS